MKSLTFVIEINATRPCVWDFLRGYKTFREWTGGTERYVLVEREDITQLNVITEVPLEQEETFNARFPLALNRIKRLAEMRMQKIIPHLWFNDAAEDAVNLFDGFM